MSSYFMPLLTNVRLEIGRQHWYHAWFSLVFISFSDSNDEPLISQSAYHNFSCRPQPEACAAPAFKAEFHEHFHGLFPQLVV